MRRVDKEIMRSDIDGNLRRACGLAHTMGYWFKVWDGDGESGPQYPVLYWGRVEPDFDVCDYGSYRSVTRTVSPPTPEVY